MCDRAAANNICLQEHVLVMFVGPMQVRSDDDDDVGSILCRAQLLWVCDFRTGAGGEHHMLRSNMPCRLFLDIIIEQLTD